MFKVGQSYSKRDVYEILSVPEGKQRGEWDKGYRFYQGNVFIFSNIGIPGRTGHDYNNYWDGDLFCWEGSTKSHIRNLQIQRMINPAPEQKNFLFTRTDDRAPFTFEGNMIVKEVHETTPVNIIWGYESNPYDSLTEREIKVGHADLKEGSLTKVLVNKYERNPLARRICLDHHGMLCKVCGFDFFKTYGDVGKGYIHVHHLVPLHSIGTEYKLNPEIDLIPVCPNCHAIIHKRNPVYSPKELKEMMHFQVNKI